MYVFLYYFKEFVALIALAQEKTKVREMELLQSMDTKVKTKEVPDASIDASDAADAVDVEKNKKWIKEKSTGHSSLHVFIQPLHSWKAHRSAISSVVVIDHPRRYLTSSTDGCVCLWNGCGEKEGLLTRGSRKDEEIKRLGYADEWSFPVNLKLRHDIEKEECDAVQLQIDQYYEERKQQQEEAAVSFRRTSNIRLSRSGSATSEELSRMSSGFYCVQGSPQMKRSKLVDQLKGKVTWEENGAEIGYTKMLKEEKRLFAAERKRKQQERQEQAPDAEGAQLDDLLSDDHIDPLVSKYIQASSTCRALVGKSDQISIQAESNTGKHNNCIVESSVLVLLLVLLLADIFDRIFLKLPKYVCM